METGQAQTPAAVDDGGGGYFETIDIQPELRIPSPQQSLFARCWQPIGTAVMDTGVLKEPRGFMRILQWFFAILAFACCADFSTRMQYHITCNPDRDAQQKTVVNQTVVHETSYPFVVGDDLKNVTCDNRTFFAMSPPGDFSSDAQFFVFTGVVAFLATMALLVLYVFFAPIYESDDKKPPLYDLIFTVIMAVFWLAASSAWANGLGGVKGSFKGHWIFTAGKICETQNDHFIQASVVGCVVTDTGSYAGATISVLLGFLNLFLWCANTWFLYKETGFFAGRNQQPGNLQQQG